MITTELQNLPLENRRRFMLRKATTTNKQTYVIKSINTSSTIYAKSAHRKTLVNMTYYQGLLEIYLRLYTYKKSYIIYICIYISNQLTAIFTFATKSQQIFEMTEQYVFVGQKLFRLSFRLCVFNKRMCNNMITNFRCF